MKLFIDTNVILDILLKLEPFFQDSYEIIQSGLQEHILCFSASSATDIYYLLRKAIGNENAKEALSKIMQLIQCVDTQQRDILNALASELPDFEDAVIDSVAARIKADYIVTRNTKDFSTSVVKALSPADFLKSH